MAYYKNVLLLVRLLVRFFLLVGFMCLSTSCHPKHEVPTQEPPPSLDSLTEELLQQIQHPKAKAFLAQVKLGQADINDPLPGKQFQRDKTTALHVIAAEGNVAVMHALVQAGAVLNTLDSKKNTPTHAAALHNQGATIQALHQLGADLNCQNEYGNTPLHKAAYAGNLAAVQALVEAQVDLDKQANMGYTALHKAVLQRHATVVDALVRAGAALHLRASFGFTPLHDAVFVCHLPVVETLLRGGADVTLEDVNRDTPLDFAQKRSTHKDSHAADVPVTQRKAKLWRRLQRSLMHSQSQPQQKARRTSHVVDPATRQVVDKENQRQQIIALLKKQTVP